MFEDAFVLALDTFTRSGEIKKKLLDDVLSRYHSSSRHYHNVHHLNHLVTELQKVKENLHDWNLLVLAVAYHDVIYNTLKQNNEEKSADYAREKLEGLLSANQMNLVCEMIIATKAHTLQSNEDINYFTDADLSILGASSEAYALYTKAIRKEYRFYPLIVYNPGRQKVLQHFLQMERIFKTDFFCSLYERNARSNIEYELQQLRSKT